jgi:predicted Rossmann fold nucleotide-binding protein DprA/Smf involved in DNA uptake
MGPIPKEATKLSPGRGDYPTTLRQYLGEQAPPSITAVGNVELLCREKLALFCSVKCPGKLILRAFDLASVLRDAGVTVIGGFHSPMEREFLAVLLRGAQPVMVCPARGLRNLRWPAEWQKPLEDGRLLLLSPFDDKLGRARAELATARNRFVAALAAEVLIAYAGPGSKTEAFAREIVGWGKPVFTLDDPANAGLVALGARPIGPRDSPWGSVAVPTLFGSESPAIEQAP